MYAAYSGRLDVVKMLVEFGTDIHCRDDNNLQAIDVARYCGHVNIVRYLRDTYINCKNAIRQSFLDNSVSASYCTRTDSFCNTAVHLTTDLQNMRTLLENGADIETENVDGLRSIHCAVRTGLVELIELLIQHGANVDAADMHGNRPLHEAVYVRLDVVQLLVQRGAKLNVQNNDGKTPLHIAVEHEQSDVAVFL